eukprot:m.267941 g.267941  ORF g.267941 m.267941 type:complete len:94 (+) comp11072_c2_seq7:1669-1950(+)
MIIASHVDASCKKKQAQQNARSNHVPGGMMLFRLSLVLVLEKVSYHPLHQLAASELQTIVLRQACGSTRHIFVRGRLQKTRFMQWLTPDELGS